MAACLASERCKGVSSFWGPYIGSLPVNPPNPWLLSDGDLDVALQQLEGALARTASLGTAADPQAQEPVYGDVGQGVGLQQGAEGADAAVGWRAAVVRARQHYSELADEVLEVLGAGEGAGADVAAALGVDKEGLMWALGMVRRVHISLPPPNDSVGWSPGSRGVQRRESNLPEFGKPCSCGCLVATFRSGRRPALVW